MTKPSAGVETARVGLLGAGYISQAHLRALKSLPGIEVAAICDVRKSQAASVASEWHIAHVFDSLERFLSADLDVVHVLVPPAFHADAAVACLEAGCDVFLEKPMGVTAHECRRIILAAEQSGRSVGINHNFTFHPKFLKLLSAIRECRLGAIQHVTACVGVPLRQLAAGQHGHWMFQSPGNIVLEQACHPLSQIHSLIGNAHETTTLISGEMTLNTGAVFYRNWQIALSCERGTGQCMLSFGADYFDFWLHVLGQDGAALIDMRRNTFTLQEKSRFMDPVDNLRQAGVQSVSIALQAARNLYDYGAGFLKLKSCSDPFSVSFKNSMHAFYEARRTGVAPPVGPGEGLRIIEACMRVTEATTTRTTRSRFEQEYADAQF